MSTQGGLPREKFRSTVESYQGLHNEASGGDIEARRDNYMALVNQYYDLATDFYEFGWGQSFHFANRNPSESFRASLARHERFLADTVKLKPGMKVLDVGCGVGGPMREIARHSGANVVGVNNNAYQIEKGHRHNRKVGMSDRCFFVKSDFMNLNLEDASFDAAYAIEATCHAPDKLALFKELHRVMKPGSEFAGYEWCLTDDYCTENADHRRIKKAVEEGNGLPDIAFMHQVDRALKGAGFELVDSRDLALEGNADRPWYIALTGRDFSVRSLPRTPIGRALTNGAVRLLEAVRIAPRGATEVSSFLNAAADALVEGGEQGVFTPLYFFHARKPG